MDVQLQTLVPIYITLSTTFLSCFGLDECHDKVTLQGLLVLLCETNQKIRVHNFVTIARIANWKSPDSHVLASFDQESLSF
jgi:hypothetical protein